MQRNEDAEVWIEKAAVRLNNVVYTGTRHGKIMQDIWSAFGLVKITQEDQGFVTNAGQFVNRFQAGAVAYHAGQTKTRKESLLSEDVW